MDVNFPEHVKMARQRLGLTQEALAATAGVDQADLSRFEACKLDIRLSTLTRILDAIDQLTPPASTMRAAGEVRHSPSRERGGRFTPTRRAALTIKHRSPSRA